MYLALYSEVLAIGITEELLNNKLIKSDNSINNVNDKGKNGLLCVERVEPMLAGRLSFY